MTEAYIQKLIELKGLHSEYTRSREPTSTEEKISQGNKKFSEEYRQVSFERSKEANYKTFCAHGTNAFVLFLAFAFANGQLLPGNARKQTGIPSIAGESKGKSRINSNFVSAVTLLDNDSSLFLKNKSDSSHPNFYAEKSVIFLPSLAPDLLETSFHTEVEAHYKNLADARYKSLMKSFLNKYKRRSKDTNLLGKITEIFEDQSMRKACIKLLNTPVIALGDGIGKSENRKLEEAEMGFERKEVLHEKMNVRSIITDKESQIFFKELINIINPEIAKNITWFTNQEIRDFENRRWNITEDSSSKKEPEDRFLDAFIKEFGNRLNFTISQNFNSSTVEKSFLYSYSPFGERHPRDLPVLKKESQPKVYKTHVEYFYPTKKGSIMDNNNDSLQKITGSATPLQQTPTSNGPNKISSHATDTQLVTPTPPQQKQPANSAPQTVTDSATSFQPIVDNQKCNSQQEHFLGISPRGWIMIAAGAIIAGVIGAALVATGVIPAIAAIGLVATAVLAGAAGVVAGGGIGYLTDTVINKCCSETTMQAA